jgi:hypothetical protein
MVSHVLKNGRIRQGSIWGSAQLYNSFFVLSEAVGRFNLEVKSAKSAAKRINCLTQVRRYKALTGEKVAFATRRAPVKKSQRIQEYLSIA